MKSFLSVALLAAALLQPPVLGVDKISESEDVLALSRSKRQVSARIIRSRSARRGGVNLEDVRATTIQVGFSYVQGAQRYLVSAFEWSDGRVVQTVATNQQNIGQHARQATLRNLFPGREYLVQIQAYNNYNGQIGSGSEVLAHTALRCYVCDGRASNEDCRGRNTILECPAGTDSCLNELRYHNNIATITKRCAQYRPEFARKIRDGRDAISQCGGNDGKDSVCSCMCKSDLCNEDELPCSSSCFPPLGAPAKGYLECTDRNRGGSMCTWRCRPGQILTGIANSICRSDGTWSVLTPPLCVAPVVRAPEKKDSIFRCPKLLDPKNGYVECAEGTNPRATCRFYCERGFILTKGSERRTCTEAGRWTGSVPTCSEITCPVINSAQNLVVNCDNQMRVGSRCILSCSGKYSLAGVTEITCNFDGTWTSRIPTCELRGCLVRQRVSRNVIMECEDLEENSAVCYYSCKPGYRLQGARRSGCSKNKWTASPPICSRIRCSPALHQPVSGFIRCSNQQYYRSNCTFSCHSDYVLSGSKSTICLDSERWSHEEATCRRISCPPIGQFNRGSYSCNNGRSKDSTCTFTCNSGYGLDIKAQSRIVCVAMEEISAESEYTGRWTYPIPKCEKMRCKSISMSSSLSRTCTLRDYREVGSFCTYRCLPGYQTKGRKRISCLRNRRGRSLGLWSSQPPTCTRMKCHQLALFINGEVSCSEGRYSGSQCRATCGRGYKIAGSFEIICLNDGRWSAKLPKCNRVVCKDPTRSTSLNIKFECGRHQVVKKRSKHYFMDYECSLTCSSGYSLVGKNSSTCGFDSQWSISADTACIDINECRQSNGGCQQNCLNDAGSYRCTCGENYSLLPDGKNCKLRVCPELLADSNSEVSCTQSRLISSTCTITCNRGYEPTNGAIFLKCRDDGTWNRVQAICTKVKCSVLRTPRNGGLSCTEKNVYDSVCASTCSEGYRMIGHEETRCEADRLWTFHPPTCRKIRCTEVNLALSNGRSICTDSNFYHSQCHYFCNAGYQIFSPNEVDREFLGDNRLLPVSNCLSDGSWSAPVPMCEKKRCVPTSTELLEQRPNGVITCTDGSLFDSTCKITCALGYQLTGAARVTCTEFATWTQDIGYCEKVECPVITPMFNLRIDCVERNLYGSVCNFTCDQGYNLIGSDLTLCQANRIWSIAPPRCKIVQCDSTGMFVRNGVVTCSAEYFYGSVCTTKCNPGYEFDEGTRSINVRKNRIGVVDSDTKNEDDTINSNCKADGEWSIPGPSCVKHECVPPAKVLNELRPNGQVICTDSERFLSICRLQCDRGYEIVGGTQTAQCTELRQWSELLGQCTKIKCKEFEAFDNGVLSCTDFNFYQSTCNFVCNPGYDLIGVNNSTCQAHRTFSHVQPFCKKIECPRSHTALKNGAATCTDGSKFESLCVYVCDPGYEMIHSTTTDSHNDTATLTCLANRTWGGDLPTCARKQCSTHDGALIKAKLNGEVECTESTFFGSRCTVICNLGYRRIGAFATQCTASADWSPTLGYCEKVECRSIISPDNAVMTCTDENRFESICSFRCQVGYERLGAETTTCQADQIYSKPAPACREITCPDTFTVLSNGVATCSNSNKFASYCSYECHPGYKLTSTSASFATCQIDYEWDVKLNPRCTKNRCSQSDTILLTALEFGSIVCTDENRFESQCALTCQIGYELTNGTGFTQCLANQLWSAHFGYCQKVSCPAFDFLENGGMTCTDSNKYKSMCTFSCNTGYELIGEKASECLANRVFTKPRPSCQRVRCPDSFLSIEHGLGKCSRSNTYESVCEYECIAGYEIIAGSSTTVCEEDRTWSQEKAVCKKKICHSDHESIVKADRNGELTCSENFLFDSVCSLECDEGYELDGRHQTRCNEDAVWEPTIGFCKKIRCPEFQLFENGEFNCTENNLYLSLCEFHCTIGYEMDGSPASTCEADRTWTSSAPSCFKISCPVEHLTLDHGSVQCSDSNLYLSTCSYSCDRGYEIVSANIIESTCTQFETWSHQKPVCLKKKCPLNDVDLIRADDIGTVTCSEKNLFESICVVECPVGYELTDGERQITCLDIARWNGTIGHCQKIKCEEPEMPSNGKIFCNDSNRFESTCTFECSSGYYLLGSPESICQADRIFSHSSPECRKINCSSDHLSLEFGSTNCSEANLFQSVCRYQCNTGYDFTDNEFITEQFVTSECLEDGFWSKIVPFCEKKTCSHEDEDFLQAHDTGEVTCTEGSRYGSRCEVKCSVGYQLIGQSVITCTNTGTWNDSIGYCEIMECQELTPQFFSQITCSDGFNFQSECHFSCEEGYEFFNMTEYTSIIPAGSDQISDVVSAVLTAECGQDQGWSFLSQQISDVPPCTKKFCPMEGWIDNINNGNISCTDSNRYGSECFFRCDFGYELVIPADNFDVTTVSITCTGHAVWDTSDPPECRKSRCYPNNQEMQETELHGKISCTQDNLFESFCSLKCNKGYQLVGGSNATQCLEGKEWSVVLGYCEKIECSPLEIPEFSSIACSDDFYFKSRCKLQCIPGYEIVDEEEEYDVERGLSCKSDGSWCGEFPPCEKIKCSEDHLQIESGSVVCTDANIYQSICEYECNQGYHMIQGQSNIAECTKEKRWSSTVPICKANRCPANETSISEASTNGDVTCTDENKFGSYCLLKCYDGYEMTGEPTTSCLDTQVWSNGLGLCNKILCPHIEATINTTLLCTDGFKFQSMCLYKCLPGYQYIETSNQHVDYTYDLQCGADQTWTGAIRNCKKLSCPSKGYENLENGRIQCSDGHLFKSQCVFVCDPGYHLVDRFDRKLLPKTPITCTADGVWSVSEPPRCIRSECTPSPEQLNEALSHGKLICTKSSLFGSKCSLRCEPGYEPISDRDFTICDSDNEWWPEIEGCKRIQCSPLTLPENTTGLMCTDGLHVGSVCSLSGCTSGYQRSPLDGGRLTCMINRAWVGIEAHCAKVRCSNDHRSLENGQAVCTDTNFVESQCNYFCSPNFKIEGIHKSAVCQASGEWSVPTPNCIPRRTCASLANNSTTFSLGILRCNENNVCNLLCNAGTVRSGAPQSTCVDSSSGPIIWSPSLGICRRRRCRSLPSPRYGGRYCVNNFLFRSVCRFRCRPGYKLIGSSSTRCGADLKWSDPSPRCDAVTCDPSLLEIENGIVTATKSNKAGSILRLACSDDRYQITGETEITCLRSGRWNKDKPICKLKTCPPLNLPNGRVECDKPVHNELGSQCRYICDDLYQIQPSNLTSTTCGTNGEWTNLRPNCIGHCDIDFEDEFENVRVHCTDSNLHHSQCRFQCENFDEDSTKHFRLYGSRELTCKESGRWNGMPPCCARTCPARGKIDVFFVLDSSASIGFRNWRKILAFVNLFISSFDVGDDGLLVGALRYHRNVDVRGEIPLGSIRTLRNLQYSISFLRYGGRGTNTGRALNHVASRDLRVSVNRPDARDFVILITDGVSQDNVDDAAEKLKQQNATVYVVGVGREQVNLSELEIIASAPKDVFIAERGVEDLTQNLIDSITSNMCENPCLLSQRYRDRANYYLTSNRQ